MRKALVFALVAGALCACQARTQRHLGMWKGTTPNGNEVSVVFSKDALQIEEGGDTIDATYQIDYSKDPIWLDFQTQNREMKCIMEFQGKDSFRVTGEGGDSPRPATFEGGEDILTFRRVKE